MESVSDFAVNLAGVDVVRSAEGVARIQQVARVGDINSVGGDSQPLEAGDALEDWLTEIAFEGKRHGADLPAEGLAARKVSRAL